MMICDGEKAGVELAVSKPSSVRHHRKESAYYESLHELPLIANTIAVSVCTGK
ncbi:hypothetical protein KCP77_01440 [Salmonella enterica subsp. enterica]|nr:hypothetical protein KCP77_01440 [Salmonella enterica subsp. enterica]